MSKSELIFFLSLLSITGLTVFDLFLIDGHPATMDGLIHINSIAQFSDALIQGDFPVIWLNNFANYGLPVGIFSHQLPLYVGAILNLILQNPVLSYKITFAIGVIVSNLLLYRFLRLYTDILPSFVGAVLFSFTPYKILNIYIRGALPEVFAGIFLPLLLLSFYYFLVKKKTLFFFVITLSIAGLALTHPMMLLLYSFIFIPYLFFLLWKEKYILFKKPLITKNIFYGIGSFIFSSVLALGIASYYFIPLFLEKKYFYFGNQTNLLSEQFLSLSNFIDPTWHYFFANDIYTRGHLIKPGILEVIFLIGGIITLFIKRNSIVKDEKVLIGLFIIIALFLLFMTLPISKSLYTFIPMLGSVQFPWRMLSGFIFIPPILCAFILERYKHPLFAFGVLIIIIGGMVSQIYGKNYVVYPSNYYHATKENLHSVNMNTVWTGKTEDYPDKLVQAEIIEGKGTIVNQQLSNSHRIYKINAETPIRMVDYTFYFPGWKVYIDNIESPIQFQDHNYRGIITYSVSPGTHDIQVHFQDTKIRFYSKIISIISLLLFIGIFLVRKKILSHLV